MPVVPKLRFCRMAEGSTIVKYLDTISFYLKTREIDSLVGHLLIMLSPFGRFKGGESAALARLKQWMWEDDMLRKYFEVRNGMLGPTFHMALYGSKRTRYQLH